MFRFKKQVVFALAFVMLMTGMVIYFNDFFLQSAQMVVDDSSCSCSAGNLESSSMSRPLRYVHGDFKGQCVDHCKYRHTEILARSEKDNSIIVSNFLHKNQFWLAQIRLNSITDVYILFEEFLPGINHVAIEFRIEKDSKIKLVNNENAMRSEVILQDSIIISPEAAPPENKKYSLWDGFFGNYALMNRLFSRDQYNEMVENTGHKLRKHKVKMEPHEARRLFITAAKDSSLVYKNQYQVLFNNCATTVIDSILFAKNLLVSKNWDHWDVLDPLRGIPSSNQLGTIRSLEWWSLLDEPSPQASKD